MFGELDAIAKDYGALVETEQLQSANPNYQAIRSSSLSPPELSLPHPLLTFLLFLSLFCSVPQARQDLISEQAVDFVAACVRRWVHQRHDEFIKASSHEH